MIDVFISYTTRGLIDDNWIKSFRDDLIRYYKSSYSKELTVWAAPVENGAGDDFRSQIAKALEQTAVLLLVLEPEYLNSPETVKEVNDYSELRDYSGDLKHFIKVITFTGNRANDLKSFISSDLLYIDFFETNSQGNQVPLIKGSLEYINEIQNINKAIWIRQLDYRRKVNSQKIINSLPQLSNSPKVYVGFSYANKQDKLQRDRFVLQLKETINRESSLQNILLFPDEFTTLGLSYEDLEELFFEDNEFGEKCIGTLINASNAIILRLINDNSAEAAISEKNLSLQNKVIQNENTLDNKFLSIFADVPKEFYTTSQFFEQWGNPLYEAKSNFKLFKEKDINTFIESYLNLLKPIIGIRPKAPSGGSSTSQKNVLIIEPYNGLPKDDLEKSRLEQEANNKRDFMQKIRNKGFTLLPSFPTNANLTEAAKYNQRHLSKSNGVIIYYGVSNDRMWCLQQQSDIYSEIESLNQTPPRKVEKAVYLDPLQQNRSPIDYSYFDYDVITTDPPELDHFLGKI